MASKTTTIKARKRGQKPIKFQKGGLHRTTGTPLGETIPAWKMAKAKAGGFGAKGKKQANLARGALAKGRKTAAKHSKRKRAPVPAAPRSAPMARPGAGAMNKMSSADLYLMAENNIANKRKRRSQ